MEIQKTHFADDDTLAYISRLERDRARLVTALAHAINSGERLSDWMREFTGPSDGTLYILTDWHETREREKALIREMVPPEGAA